MEDKACINSIYEKQHLGYYIQVLRPSKSFTYHQNEGNGDFESHLSLEEQVMHVWSYI